MYAQRPQFGAIKGTSHMLSAQRILEPLNVSHIAPSLCVTISARTTSIHGDPKFELCRPIIFLDIGLKTEVTP